MAKRLDEITAKGAQLIAIGNGDAKWANAFVKAENVTFAVYVDPGRRTYAALGMNRALLGILDPKVISHGARASKAGFKMSMVRGDPFQNGGVAVVGADGELRYVHIENESGDLADLDEVIGALS